MLQSQPKKVPLGSCTANWGFENYHAFRQQKSEKLDWEVSISRSQSKLSSQVLHNTATSKYANKNYALTKLHFSYFKVTHKLQCKYRLSTLITITLVLWIQKSMQGKVCVGHLPE